MGHVKLDVTISLSVQSHSHRRSTLTAKGLSSTSVEEVAHSHPAVVGSCLVGAVFHILAGDAAARNPAEGAAASSLAEGAAAHRLAERVAAHSLAERVAAHKNAEL